MDTKFVEDIQNFIEKHQDQLEDLLIATTIFCLSVLFMSIFKSTILRRFKKVSQKTRFDLDDMIIGALSRLSYLFYFAVSLLVAIQFVYIEPSVRKILVAVSAFVIGYFMIIVINQFIKYFLGKALARDNESPHDVKDDNTVINFIGIITRGLLLGLLVILILQNIGYNVTALLGGLGVLGVAFAFGVQNILEDIFSFLSIYFDKPFRVGDFVVVGDDLGTVSKIGIKSTRIRTLEGQELVISNTELTSSRINNFKRMEERRVDFEFGVTYETTNEQLKLVNDIVEDILDSIEIAHLDRVHFKAFGDFALIFEVVYYVNSNDYNTYMDVQQKINLEIKERFEKEKIEMAYPTQKLFLQNIE